MKINDANLQLLINMYQKIDSTDHVHTDAIAAFSELQQFRAAKHERRWRKIADEGLPYDMDVRVCNAESGHLYEFNKSAVKKNRRWIASFATHWRPQELDLPEETS